MKTIILSTLLIIKIQTCFLIHFVYYGPVTEYDYDRLTNFNYPYIFHLNEPITLPDNYKLNRTLTPVEKSDVKKMQVIYHHGGLYLDNDHLIDTECITKLFCPLKDGMYLLDWTDRGGQSWYKAVPISFIYASHPKNPTIHKIITSYNQSIPDTIYFSGPFHAQTYRDQMKFVKVDRSCEYHIGIQSWNKEKNLQFNWITRKWDEFKKADMTKPLQIKRAAEQRQFFQKLWVSHSVIYPHNFDYDSFEPFNPNFNHIEIVDKRNLKFKVVKYAQIDEIKQRMVQFQQFYKHKTITVMQSFEQIQQQKKKEQQKHEQQLFMSEIDNQKAQSSKNPTEGQKPSNNQNEPSGDKKPKDRYQQNLNNNVQQRLEQKSSVKYFLQVIFALFTILFMIKLITFMIDGKQDEDKKNYKKRASDEAELMNQKIQRQDQQQLHKQNSLINGWLCAIGAYLLILVFILFIDDKPSHLQQKLMNNIHQIVTPQETNKIITEPQIKIQNLIAPLPKQQKIQIIQEPAMSQEKYRQLYGIKWSPILDYQLIQNNIGIKDLGIYYDIHINSKFDFLNLTTKPKFKQFSKDFLDNLKYTVLQFDFNEKLEKPKQIMNYNQFWTQAQMQSALQNIQKWSKGPQLPNNVETYLAKYLVYKNESFRIKQLEHYYMNKKYNFDQIQKQQSICVIGTTYQIAIKSDHQRFFQSIQNQNYSNYKIILIDDHQSNNLASHWFNYLNHGNSKLKNKVKIIRNHQKMGALANNYAYVKKFCEQNDIVVSMKVEDAFIGFQTFNVLNALYQDPEIWLTYSRDLQFDSFEAEPKFGVESNRIMGKWEDYRIAKEWNTSGLKAYRQQVMDKVPIQQLIQYSYDNVSGLVVPKFPVFGSDRYLTYSQLQICGKNRTKFIEEGLYLSHDQGIGKPCQIEQRTYYEHKAKSKRPIKPLKSLDDEIQYLPYANYTKRFIINIRDSYNILTRCKGIFSMSNNLI